MRFVRKESKTEYSSVVKSSSPVRTVHFIEYDPLNIPYSVGPSIQHRPQYLWGKEREINKEEESQME